MQTYEIGLVPGPVSVPPELRAAYQINYGSADLEEEFLRLYQRCETHLGKILATRNRVVIKSGEGMIALWSGLKSVLRPGDKVLAVANGVFGYGIGDMAQHMTVDITDKQFPGRIRIQPLQHIQPAIGSRDRIRPIGAHKSRTGNRQTRSCFII